MICLRVALVRGTQPQGRKIHPGLVRGRISVDTIVHVEIVRLEKRGTARDSYMEYVVQTTAGDGRTWGVPKRYGEFQDLQRSMVAAGSRYTATHALG